MYAAIFVTLAFVNAANAALVDTNCTVGGLLTPTAVACLDKYPRTTCDAIYAVATTEIAPGTNQERRNLCFATTATGTAFDAGMQRAAVATCPKTCGYCCLTPEYSCTNAIIPKMNCAAITADMCLNPAWRPLIASECPNMCGFCLTGGCIDAVPDCSSQFPAICNDPSMASFVNTNCQKTCQRCATTTTASASVTTVRTVTVGTATTTRNTATCADSRPNCVAWAANGYCTNAFYTAATIRSTCGRTCNRC